MQQVESSQPREPAQPGPPASTGSNEGGNPNLKSKPRAKTQVRRLALDLDDFNDVSGDQVRAIQVTDPDDGESTAPCAHAL